MAKHYDKQFKLDAVQYYHDHKNLGLQATPMENTVTMNINNINTPGTSVLHR